MGREIIRDDVMIKISTERCGGNIEGCIDRPDKFKITFYDNVSLSSLNRLEKFALKKKDDGFKVHGLKRNSNMQFAIFLQERETKR